MSRKRDGMGAGQAWPSGVGRVHPVGLGLGGRIADEAVPRPLRAMGAGEEPAFGQTQPRRQVRGAVGETG
jgi:hypothetical protein